MTSSNMSVKFEGLDKLIKDFSKVTKSEVNNTLRTIVRVNGSEMQRQAKDYVPYDTGALQSSIGITMKDGGLTAEIAPTMHYAGYVEYGTRNMSAQPYMRPAYLEQEIDFRNDMEEVIKKLIGR